MRWNSLLGSAAPELAALILLFTPQLASTQGIPTPISPPKIDISSLGRVALAGNFDTISIYAYEGQTQGSNTNGSQSVLQAVSSGDFASVSAADANINAMCPFVMEDGTLAGVIVGGNFTSLGGVDAQGIALMNPETHAITPLPGINGVVNAIYCDQETNSVYVGGAFQAANSTNAIAWLGMTGWTNLPFAGFNSPVTSITKAPNGHIVFGGSFSGLGNATSPTQKHQQVINLQTAKIEGSASVPPFEAKNIICPSNASDSDPWLLPDNAPGYWRATMGFGYTPTKLRVHNTKKNGKGTKVFRFTALPINGIMNFTYTDPASGEEVACDARCPLVQDPAVPFQDFTFVNGVGMNGFQIDISEWYGSGAGLAGVELFQDEIFAYAVNDFNEPSCGNNQFSSQSSLKGDWAASQSPGADYLIGSISGSDRPSITFEPDIKQSGNYSVLVYTPGCLRENACSSRGMVNITASFTAGSPYTTQLFQTNNNDKFDQVYLGPIDTAGGSFRPSVTMTPLSDQGEVVASKVRFDIVNTTGGLNGLYEFDTDSVVADTNFSSSAINNVGTSLDPGASITALVTNGDTIYAAGNFTDTIFQNIMGFSDNKAQSLPGEGLNAAVNSLYSLDDLLYVGGNFTNTSKGNTPGLNNIAAYSYSKKAWVALGAGLDGTVDRIVPLQINTTADKPETCVSFNGAFGQILAAGGTSAMTAPGFAIWVPSRSKWLSDTDIAHLQFNGQLTAYADTPNGPQLVAGSLTSAGMEGTGAVRLESDKEGVRLDPLPIDFKQSPQQGSLAKRDLPANQNISGVVTGLFYESGKRNVSVYAGHFSAASTSGPTVENLLFLNGSNNDAITGLPEGIDQNSTFLAVAMQNDLLFAGGSVTGRIGDSPVNGIVVYDFVQANYIPIQPPALQGENVIVNSIKTRPGSSDVYVAGSFDTAGALGCESICVYQTSTSQWVNTGSDLAGVVTSLTWASKSKLYVAGNLTIAGNSSVLATYEPDNQKWTPLSFPEIPGPITAFTHRTMDVSRWFAAGKDGNDNVYIGHYDGQRYHALTAAFNPHTNIRGLQVLGLSEKHAATADLENDQSLLITGQLDLVDFGNVSAVLYNGTAFTPFILASNSDGGAGSLSGLFSSRVNNLKGGSTLRSFHSSEPF